MFCSCGNENFNRKMKIIYNEGAVDSGATFSDNINFSETYFGKRVSKFGTGGTISATISVTFDNAKDYDYIFIRYNARAYANYGSANTKMTVNGADPITVATVSSEDSGVKQYSEIYKVDPTLDTNTFSWYLKAVNNSSEPTWGAYAEANVYSIVFVRDLDIKLDLLQEFGSNILTGSQCSISTTTGSGKITSATITGTGSTAAQLNLVFTKSLIEYAKVKSVLCPLYLKIDMVSSGGNVILSGVKNTTWNLVKGMNSTISAHANGITWICRLDKLISATYPYLALFIASKSVTVTITSMEIVQGIPYIK